MIDTKDRYVSQAEINELDEFVREQLAEQGCNAPVINHKVSVEVLQEYCRKHNIKSFRDDHKGMPYDENDWVEYNLPNC